VARSFHRIIRKAHNEMQSRRLNATDGVPAFPSAQQQKEHNVNGNGVIRLTLMAFATMTVLGIAVFFSSGGFSSAVSTARAQEARSLTVLAGAGQDTMQPHAFFPEQIRIRAGDTVTWEYNGSANHTATFVAGSTPKGASRGQVSGPPGAVIPAPNAPVPGGPPGATMLNPEEILSSVPSGSTYSGSGFFNSGRLGAEPLYAGGPDRRSFSLVFDTPGRYEYVCLVHQDIRMVGSVEVMPADALDVDDQASINARGQSEFAAIMGLIERVKNQPIDARRDAGPNGTTLWTVAAGNPQSINDLRAQLFEFMPKNLTVTSGDTVIWESRFFHSVTFVPVPPPPDPFLPQVQPDGSVWMVQNPLIFTPERPAAAYDPALHFNSAPLGPFRPNGSSWTLTFERPGTYQYFCGIHLDEGMVGTITVVPR
jgi:plastocyanin